MTVLPQAGLSACRRAPSSGSFAAAVSLGLAALTAVDGAISSRAEAQEADIVLATSDVHVVGTSDLVATVVDLDVLPDGRVWVLNSVEPFFVGFGPDGVELGAHGHRGAGPEEFGAPGDFVAGGIDGEAWVFDRERHRFIRVSRPDSPREEIAVPDQEIPRNSVLNGMNPLAGDVRTARLGDELILPRRSGLGELDVPTYWWAAWTSDLVALDPATGSVRGIVELGNALGDPTPRFDLSGAPLPFPLWFRLWAVCGDEVRVYDRLRNQIRVFSPQGGELAPTALPPGRYPGVTRRQFAEAIFDVGVAERLEAVDPRGPKMSPADSSEILDGLLSRVTGGPGELANLLPRYVDYRCDQEGTQWIQPFDLGLSGGLWEGFRASPTWLRIGGDASVSTVRFPDRFHPYRFTPDRIWGVQQDELDQASVAWIAEPGG